MLLPYLSIKNFQIGLYSAVRKVLLGTAWSSTKSAGQPGETWNLGHVKSDQRTLSACTQVLRPALVHCSVHHTHTHVVFNHNPQQFILGRSCPEMRVHVCECVYICVCETL